MLTGQSAECVEFRRGLRDCVEVMMMEAVIERKKQSYKFDQDYEGPMTLDEFNDLLDEWRKEADDEEAGIQNVV